MLNELENHNEFKKLIEEKYSLSLISAHVVVNDVYYLDWAGNLQKAKLAAPINYITPTSVGAPFNHQMHWSGERPYYIDGSAIPKLGNAKSDLKLGETKFLWNLSNKPPDGFPTYHELIEHYVALISAPAHDKFGVTSLTGVVYDVPPETSPFKVRDSFSARAEIIDLNQLLSQDHIAIIGLGGTGAYLLDFVTKTPVKAIDAYDFDIFQVHNGFRSPGEVPFDKFGHPKVDVYKEKYEPFRHQINFENKSIGQGDDAYFNDVTFAFVCIDDGKARGEICEMLIRLGIPFIDVGMGVEKEAGMLDGLLRTTIFTPETATAALERVPRDRRENQDAYRVFVQIAELNALNAALAVVRYKQYRGFYTDDVKALESLFALGSLIIVHEP